MSPKLPQSALVREAQMMKKFSHPALLPLQACFVVGKELWLITPFMVRSCAGLGVLQHSAQHGTA
jgi:hypothetical protein